MNPIFIVRSNSDGLYRCFIVGIDDSLVKEAFVNNFHFSPGESWNAGLTRRQTDEIGFQQIGYSANLPCGVGTGYGAVDLRPTRSPQANQLQKRESQAQVGSVQCKLEAWQEALVDSDT